MHVNRNDIYHHLSDEYVHDYHRGKRDQIAIILYKDLDGLFRKQNLLFINDEAIQEYNAAPQ